MDSVETYFRKFSDHAKGLDVSLEDATMASSMADGAMDAIVEITKQCAKRKFNPKVIDLALFALRLEMDIIIMDLIKE